MSKLTHFNQSGEAHMVDVGNKEITHRIAKAAGKIAMKHETLNKIIAGDHKKGDVLGVARIAGIMAAKKSSELIPLCHPLPLSKVNIELTANKTQQCITCVVTAETYHVTGVEMEALTAVSITLLTIYDMCKAIDKGMTIKDIHLLEKSGGKSGLWKK
jgi:cyclic pyranopterin phosphate synthase